VKRLLLVLAALSLPSIVIAQNPPQPGWFVDTQFLWFNSPIKYLSSSPLLRVYDRPGLAEVAPRFVVGYDDVVGARARWWSMDRTASPPDIGGTVYGPSRFQLDVVDLEATTHIRHNTSDFLFAGGARIAQININERAFEPWQTTFEKGNLAGLTAAAEGRTNIFGTDIWSANFVYGGRLSLLSADWHGQSFSATFRQDINNDRYIVPEIFTGIEGCYRSAFTRLTVEMQDWRGSAEGQSWHNYGFTGFGFDLGWRF
jgi:hypothetical protein